MTKRLAREVTRRGFLATAAGSCVAAGMLRAAPAGERPPVTNPRATDGDDIHEPNWDERLTLTVGPEQGRPGGTRRQGPAGRRRLRRAAGRRDRPRLARVLTRCATPIFLPSRLRLLGSGADSVITKIPRETVTLADDSDWYDQEITLADGRRISAWAMASCCGRRTRTTAGRP